ncbi:MAG: Hsp70 family protein [Verrucomicrobia bacterium]|nr:Hsp70 family protein [Verrucomicrobiota bacterium]MCH8510426.1 Hsp70 family protein [Kiritimatiellia bacterium]
MHALFTLVPVALIIIVTLLFSRQSHKMPELEPMVAEPDSPILGEEGVLVEDLRIEVEDGKTAVILPAGAPVEARKWETLSTTEKHQEFIDFNLYRGMSELAADNTLIGKFRIFGIPKGRAGGPQIQARFAVNDGAIEIATHDLKRGVNMITKKL